MLTVRRYQQQAVGFAHSSGLATLAGNLLRAMPTSDGQPERVAELRAQPGRRWGDLDRGATTTATNP